VSQEEFGCAMIDDANLISPNIMLNVPRHIERTALGL